MGIEEIEKKDAMLSLLRAGVQSLVGELRSIKMALGQMNQDQGQIPQPSSPLPLWSFSSLGQKQVQLRAPCRSNNDHDHFGNHKNGFHFLARIVMRQDLSMNPLIWSSPPSRMYGLFILYRWPDWSSYCHSVAKSCPTLFNAMNCIPPGFSVLHHLPEFA